MKRLILLAVLLPACRSSAHEDLPEPQLEVLPEWASQSTPGTVDDGPWWNTFDDAGLTAVIEEALVANPSLRISATRIQAAAAEARIAGSELKPTVGLNGSASRAKNIFVGLPVPGGSNVLSSHATTYGVSLDVSWEADLWGRISSQAAAADHELAATQADYRAAQQSLAAQTAKAWFAWQTARLETGISERAAQSYADAVEMIRRRVDGGRATAFDFKLAETELAVARAELAAQREVEARSLRQLELLLGRHPSGELEAEAALPDNPPAPPVGVPGELVGRRPDLAAAELRLLAADDSLYSARASLYPRLTLSGSAGTLSEDPNDLVDPDFSVWSLAAGLAQPIFQGGRLRAGVDLADARVQGALASFETALLNAIAEVEIALVSEQRLDDLQQETDVARDLAIETNALAEDRYSAGRLDVLELLAAERNALENERAAIRVQRQRLLNRVDLHLALGGGFGATETSQ